MRRDRPGRTKVGITDVTVRCDLMAARVALRAIRNDGQDTINDAGQQIIRRQLNVPPTLTIRPGFPGQDRRRARPCVEPYRG
jgi:hypothetical protein